MISSLTIQGYRGFERFQMSGLGRLNLLVGTNNSGKSSILEGIFLLMSAGDPAALWHVLSIRGESVVSELSSSPLTYQTEAEVRHLFHGHEIRPGFQLALKMANQTDQRSVQFVVEEISSRPMTQREVSITGGVTVPGLALSVTGDPRPILSQIQLTQSGHLNEGYRSPHTSGISGRPAIFISSESLTRDELVGLWNSVILTEDESLVLKALQFIDPNIERIAVQAAKAGTYYGKGSRGGFIVKLRGTDRPVPIGSLGDGMWRMLVMAIAITQCRGGVLLVDEIDTGLHYSVMSDMWRLIFNAAKDLNVQVFATTHSYDCVYSLAHICADADEQNPITVQRIEPGKPTAIPYAQNEIRIAADREIEVR